MRTCTTTDNTDKMNAGQWTTLLSALERSVVEPMFQGSLSVYAENRVCF